MRLYNNMHTQTQIKIMLAEQIYQSSLSAIRQVSDKVHRHGVYMGMSQETNWAISILEKALKYEQELHCLAKQLGDDIVAETRERFLPVYVCFKKELEMTLQVAKTHE